MDEICCAPSEVFVNLRELRFEVEIGRRELGENLIEFGDQFGCRIFSIVAHRMLLAKLVFVASLGRCQAVRTGALACPVRRRAYR